MSPLQRTKMLSIRNNAYELASEISALMAMFDPSVKATEASVRLSEERATDALHDIAKAMGYGLVPLSAPIAPALVAAE